MDPLENLGQNFMGAIKSYNSQKGYGFATCDKLEGDLFFLHRNLTIEVANEAQFGRDLSGEEIAFTCDVTPEGKPQASEIRVLEGSGKKWKKGKGKGKGKGKSYGGSWGGAEYYESRGKGYGKSRPKGGKETRIKGTDPDEPGESLLDGQRVQGTVRTYNHNSKWGFAVTDVDIPNAENIFIHMNNLHQEMIDADIIVREGDIIEMRLEEIDGKPVAREIMLARQDPLTYDGQWMTGTIKTFCEGRGFGHISAPRVFGDIWFAKNDMPVSLISQAVEKPIVFKLVIGPDGKAKGKMLNYVGNTEKLECVDRLRQVVNDLEQEGYVDETAAKSLVRTPCDELFAVLPEIEFYNAENPSSFIVGALTRFRKGGTKGGFVATPYTREEKGAARGTAEGKGTATEVKVEGKGAGGGHGKAKATATASEAKGKSKGKGKGGKSWRAAPY